MSMFILNRISSSNPTCLKMLLLNRLTKTMKKIKSILASFSDFRRILIIMILPTIRLSCPNKPIMFWIADKFIIKILNWVIWSFLTTILWLNFWVSFSPTINNEDQIKIHIDLEEIWSILLRLILLIFTNYQVTEMILFYE